MGEYDVFLVIVTVVNFAIAILNFAKASGKDTRDLKDAIIKLTTTMEYQNSKLVEETSKNDDDHKTFYKTLNNHETRIGILEDHEKTKRNH